MDHIQNPLTGEDVSIYSNEAKKLIKKYIKLIQSGDKKGKGKGEGSALKKQDPNLKLLISMLAFVKNMMNNPNKEEFEEHMKEKPKVYPEFLKYFKEHINGKIEGPGIEEFILFILFHLEKHLKKLQKGGSGVGSDNTTKEDQQMGFVRGKELALQDQVGEYIDEEGSNSNMIPNMLKFLWFTLFIGLVGSIYKTTVDFLNTELDLKTPIFEALEKASSEYLPDDLKALHDLGEIIKKEESLNIGGDLDLIPFSSGTPTDVHVVNGLVVYEGIQEESQEDIQEDTSENEKITIYGSDFELDNLISGYELKKPITIKTIVSAVYHSDSSMILDLYTTGLLALGTVSDTIQFKAIKKLSEIPEKLIDTARDRLLDPNDPITLRASRLYSFTKSSYAFGFGSSIALKELRRTTQDIQRDTSRYIQDIQTDVTRAMEDKIEGFTKDILSYIYFLQALLGCLGTLFLIPLYKKITEKKIEDVSSPEINVLDSNTLAIEDIGSNTQAIEDSL
jgi:hypothetical protein